MTADQIRRALEDTARQRAALREQDAELQAQELLLRKMLAEAERRLRHEPTGSRIRSRLQLSNQKPRTRALSISAANTHNASEAKRMLLEAGKSDGAIASFLRVGRSTVAAWHNGTRAIPRAHAQRLLAEFAVPLSAWPRVAD